MYYSYHATIKKLIKEGKLLGYYFTKKHNSISPALVLVFNDSKHHIMPVRQYRWKEYKDVLKYDDVNFDNSLIVDFELDEN